MYYLETGSKDPYFNLAFEEYVFEHLDPKESYFILWQNDPSVIVGKYQNTIEEINPDYIKEHGIKVARRLSGGGAVYHDTGNLNYTFIVNAGDMSKLQFEVFIKPVIQTLEKMGVHAEFNGRNDILIDGRKFSGNSQYLKKKRVMHHGCLMLDSNLKVLEQVLKVKPVKYESKGIKSVRSRVTTINEHAKRKYSLEEFKCLLKETMLEHTILEPLFLTEEQLSEIRNLRDEKYETWMWNYGFSPDYDVKYEQKFEQGLVSVYLKVMKGQVEQIRIFGDFFGNEEMQVLEERIRGLYLDESLEHELEQLQIKKYMYGFSAKEIAALLHGE